MKINKNILCSAFYFQHTFIFFKLVRLTGWEVFPPYYRYRTKGLSESIKMVGGNASTWIRACLILTLRGSFSHHWKLNDDPSLVSLCGIRQFHRSCWKSIKFYLFSPLKVESCVLDYSWKKMPWGEFILSGLEQETQTSDPALHPGGRN